jgi:RNase H-like domain found in reverse transcriptase/Reverse transcriptase (RNA-dependent DNA polymerase)/Integrase zinc binding domain
MRLDAVVHTSDGAKIAVTPMADSGATGVGFVDPTFVERCGMAVQPSQRRIELADGSIVRAEGEVTLEYALAARKGPPLQMKSTFVITKLKAYELILGIGWLQQHHANVAFHERSMKLKIDGKGDWQSVCASERVDPESGESAMAPLRMTAISERTLTRMGQKGDIAQLHAVFVRPTKGENERPAVDVAKVVPGSDDPRIKALLEEFGATVFPDEPPPGVPPKRGVEHAIELKPGSRPPPVRPLRHGSTRDAAILQKYIEDGLRSGQLQASTSPYGSMALVVLKKDGTPRVVIDYRAINEITIKNKYPLPLMDELFDRVVNAKWFTKIDLRSGFHQIAIRPEDREKTAFRTRYGSFEYTVLPMGLCNAPGTFMQLMNETFADMLDKSVLCFLDDILIYSRTEEEHLQHVRAVLRRLKERKLYGKLSKCEFMQREVEFLGHRIGADGLRVAPDKISGVRDWQTPTSVTEVRSFLGLANFYRRFVEGYARIAMPLTELTKDNVPFVWGSDQQQAFDRLKAALCSAPVLIIPDQTKPFLLNCDACKYAVGAVLQQDLGNGPQPVAYYSHKMTDAERNYDVREKEFMAIYLACLHWRPYLHGTQPFRLLSDHKSLVYYMTMPHLSDRLARWVEKMQQFDCGIEYIKGEENVVADALSRRSDHEPTKATATHAVKALNLFAVRARPATKPDEPHEVRQAHIDAAKRVLPPAPDRPAPRRDGTIVMPSQRCTANTNAGRQCGQRTAMGHVCWSHLRRDYSLRVQKSTIPGAGRGLFAYGRNGLPEGFNIPYTGDLIELTPQRTGGPYVLQLRNDSGIDAARTNCSVARWVNDPRGGFDTNGRPLRENCKFVLHTQRDSSQRVGAVRTLRPVERGEELLVKYGQDYWRLHCANQKAAAPRTATNEKRRQKRIAGKLRQNAARVNQLAASTKFNDNTTSVAPMVQAIRTAAASDPQYQQRLASPPTDWHVESDVLFDDQHRLVVPNDAALRTRILAELHDSVTGAHAGRDRMTADAKRRFHWDGMATAIEQYVTTCDACQRNKTSKQLTPGLLMPLPIPEEPCMHWTTDAVSGFRKSKRGHTSIQVFIDRRTKLKRLAATRITDGAVQMAHTILRTIIGPHGVPMSMLSDRDTRITARVTTELQRALGTQTVLSTAFHPQTDGQSEREIQTLTTVLRSYVNAMGDDWDEYLPALELALNSKVQASTGASPHYLVYGTEPRLPVDCMLDELRPTTTRHPVVGDRLSRMKTALAAAFDRTEIAQARQKRAADRHRRLMELKSGDLVMLSTEGLQLRSGTHKLTQRYIGPFKVTDVVNANAVTLELPEQLEALHATFNISRLKLYRDGTTLFPGRPRQHHAPPAVEADTNGVTEYEVQCIVAERGPVRNRQLLVRWLGYAPEHDEWKPRRDLLRTARRAVEEWDALQESLHNVEA